MNNDVKEMYKSIKINTLESDNSELPKPSDEQNEIIFNFKQGYNLKIEAVAGAGKTTTLLHLAQVASKNFCSKSVILTYNKGLQVEIKKMIDDCGLKDNCSVYTYHGYASKIYSKSINNDKILRQSLQREPIHNPKIPILLLDEVQDMNEDYHSLVSKIIYHGQMLVLVGDRRQCINEYIGASDKYLIDYAKYFDTGRSWKCLTLRTSYRMTPAIANFVNKNIVGQELIIGGNIKNENIKPLYYYSEWNFSKDDILTNAVKTFGPDQVVIMKASVASVSLKKTTCKSNSKLCPLGTLVNNSKNIKFCVREDEALSEKEMKGKVLLSSFNSMKGRQRQCVIIYGFGESYFTFFDKTWPDKIKELPNILYVGCTRAQSCLMLVQDDKDQHFRTTNENIIHSTCNVIGSKNDKVKNKVGKNKQDSYVITDVIKHRTTTDVLKMLNFINVSEINNGSEPLKYDHLIDFGSYYEDMRTYYGVLIPVLAEYKLKGDIRFTDEIPIPDESNGMTEPPHIVTRYNQLVLNKEKTYNEWMELVVLHGSMLSGYFFYVDQINNYNWVDPIFINESVERLIATIPKNGDFEIPIRINKYNKNKYSKYNLSGSVDYLGEDEIWEFKNSLSLSDEHKIQCACYIAVYFLQHGLMKNGKLFNTRTLELLEITLDNPKEFMDVLMINR